MIQMRCEDHSVFVCDFVNTHAKLHVKPHVKSHVKPHFKSHVNHPFRNKNYQTPSENTAVTMCAVVRPHAVSSFKTRRRWPRLIQLLN